MLLYACHCLAYVVSLQLDEELQNFVSYWKSHVIMPWDCLQLFQMTSMKCPNFMVCFKIKFIE